MPKIIGFTGVSIEYQTVSIDPSPLILGGGGLGACFPENVEI